MIAAEAGGVLARQAYLAQGVRQSLFAGTDRARLYDLFERPERTDRSFTVKYSYMFDLFR